MKKTYVEKNGERFALYANIEGVYGEWIIESGGDALTLNDYEDAQADGEIDEIDEILSCESTVWEECDEEDLEYIRDWLETWGII